MRAFPLLLLAGASLLAGGPAGATQYCSVLKSPDGFVALRAGPGTNFPVVARMKEDDEVRALDGQKGPWMQVHHWHGQERHDDATRSKYRKGWAHKRYIGECG
jgi:uncharacterized protein YraI